MRSEQGFTLIEIVIIVAIVGILGTVSIPKSHDMLLESKVSACKGGLSGLLTAVAVWQSERALTTGADTFPPLDSMNTYGSLMQGAIPANPFQSPDNAPDSIVEGLTRGVTVGTRGGWTYKPSTDDIWANTSTSIPGSGCAGPRDINENTW